MMKMFQKIFSSAPPIKPIKITVKSLGIVTQIECRPGQNLMDVTNRSVNEDCNIYGLCDKQLACTTCSVNILSHYEKLDEPVEQQLDILYGLPDFKENSTRMACQIYLKEEFDGMIVSIPKKKKPISQ